MSLVKLFQAAYCGIVLAMSIRPITEDVKDIVSGVPGTQSDAMIREQNPV